MKKPLILAYVLLLSLALGLSFQEDDLVFDDVGENSENGAPVLTVGRHGGHKAQRRYEHESPRDGRRHRVERLLGVQDAFVPVGHVFRMKIPRQAFSGNVDFYEVTLLFRIFPRFFGTRPELLSDGVLALSIAPAPRDEIDKTPRAFSRNLKSFETRERRKNFQRSSNL